MYLKKKKNQKILFKHTYQTSLYNFSIKIFKNCFQINIFIYPLTLPKKNNVSDKSK